MWVIYMIGRKRGIRLLVILSYLKYLVSIINNSDY